MLEEYPWLQKIWDLLLDTERQNRLSHAYLFKSKEKLGTELLIENLAKGLLCIDDGIKPCLICRNCTLAKTGNSPDMKILGLMHDKTSINVDVIRELKDFFSSKPSIATSKIAIINQVGGMNLYASNALLKILEEPPVNAFLLLNWENPGLVPKTLISRCQQISIPNPSKEDTQKWLETKGIDISKQLYGTHRMIRGSPIELLAKLKDDSNVEQTLEHVVSDIIQMSVGDGNIVKLSDKYFNDEPLMFIESMQTLCHAIATLKYGELPKNLYLPIKQKLHLQTLSDKLELADISELNESVLGIKRDCLNSAGMKSGDIVETLFYKWLTIFKNTESIENENREK